MEEPSILNCVSLSGVDRSALLRHWSWCVPSGHRLVCVTQLGDAFLHAPDESVWLLDAGRGTLERVAGHELQWRAQLRDLETVDLWSGRVLVARLLQGGLSLAAGQCFTYWQSPVLGGTYDPSNFKVVGVQQHFAIWGPLLGSIKGLPDGTSVKFVVTP